jgi:Xaa-Pro aminopeptidase
MVFFFSMTNENLLILGSSERNADLYYATRFAAPDPFVFLRLKGRDHILVSDLEIDRARKESSVRSVLSLSALSRTFKKKTGRSASLAELVAVLVRKHRVKELTVPPDFPLSYALAFKKTGIHLRCRKGLFFPERLIKSRREIAAITQAIRATERSMAKAVRILKKSSVRRGKLYFQGTLLTSDFLRKAIHRVLLDHGCTGEHTIVACGHHSIDPHDRGSGPLFANKPVLFDIFPRNDATFYYGDFSRTVVKGKASPRLKAMYEAVKEGQEIAFGMIADNVPARTIHEAVHGHFEKLGFGTGKKAGRMQGFFHSTGHGLGLEIHEPPRLGPGEDILKAGQVVTVEPGLYYKGTGGVRLEDVVLVTKNGCINLTRFPKVLEL